MQNKTFISYLRVSTDRQGSDGLGIQAQRKSINDYIYQSQGELLSEFVEVESGRNCDRIQLNAALDYCDLTNSILIVARIDRLTRNLNFLTNLQQRGIKFIFTDMPQIDPLSLNIIGALAEHEVKLISERTKSALAAAKQRGTRLGNPNLDVVRNRNVGPANHARTDAQRLWREKILKIISHIESEGHQTCRAIADELNRRGITSYRGTKFTVPIVSKLLRYRA